MQTVKILLDWEQMTGALFRNVYLQLYPEIYPHCSRKIGAIVIAYLSVVQGSDPRADIKVIFGKGASLNDVRKNFKLFDPP